MRFAICSSFVLVAPVFATPIYMTLSRITQDGWEG